MKNCTLLITLLFAFFITTITTAQISTVKPDRACINCPTDEPDASAVLEIQATDKGILIPRVASVVNMNTSTGLLVYDNSDNTFKYYNGTQWVAFGGNLQTTVLGNGNTASGARSTALGRTNDATGEESLTAGFSNEAIGIESTAIGNLNDAMENRSTALGYANEATGMGSTAVGSLNNGTGNESTVVGYLNEATTFGSTAVGYNNDATGGNATAYGHQNVASGVVSVAIGRSSLAAGTSAIAIGDRDTVNISEGIAIGILNKAFGDSGTSIGNRNTASSFQTIAVGYGNSASGSGASAFGNQNEASSQNSIAMGYSNTASSVQAVATGYENSASGSGASAFGYQNEVSDAFGGAFGHFNIVASDSSSVVGFRNEIIKTNASSYRYLTAIGIKNKIENGSNHIAVGYNNLIDSTALFRSSAIGYENQVSTPSSSAFGIGNEVYGNALPLSGFGQGNAFGIGNEAGGFNACAFGGFNNALAESSSAFGVSNTSTGLGSSAFGYGTIANLRGLTVIGNSNDTLTGDPFYWIPEEPVFMVGNGETPSIRSTALTILKNGNTGIGTMTPLDAKLVIEAPEYDDTPVENVAILGGTGTHAHLKMIGNGISSIKFVDSGSGNSNESDFQVRATGNGGLEIRNADNANDEFASSSIIAYFETSSDPYQFTVNGDALASGGIWTNSDRRLKKNIKDLDDPLEKIMQLQPKRYHFDYDNAKLQYLNLPIEGQIGLIAQEVEKILPEVVKTDRSAVNDNKEEEKDESAVDKLEDLKAVNYTALIPVLIGAVQEQQSQIEEKEEAIEELKEQNTRLEERLAKIEAQLAQISTLHSDKVQLENSTNSSNTPQLQQNQPNPFSDHTIIQYFIPETVQQAQLQFHDLNGKVLKVMEIVDKGAGQVELETTSLISGTYSYSLVLDGKIFETKRMVLSR